MRDKNYRKIFENVCDVCVTASIFASRQTSPCVSAKSHLSRAEISIARIVYRAVTGRRLHLYARRHSLYIITVGRLLIVKINACR